MMSAAAVYAGFMQQIGDDDGVGWLNDANDVWEAWEEPMYGDGEVLPGWIKFTYTAEFNDCEVEETP